MLLLGVFAKLSEISTRFFLSYLSSIFSPLDVKLYDKDEKISCRVDESITPFITQFISWYDGLTMD